MKKGVFIFWSIFVAAALIRVLFSLYQDVPDIGLCYKQPVKGEGIVIQDPERKEDGQVLVVLAHKLSVASTSALLNPDCATDVLIRMKTKLYPRFTYNDHVSFSGKISAPFNFKSDSGRAFDYIGYLAKDDVFFEIKSAKVEYAVGKNRENTPVSAVGQRNGSIFSVFTSANSILFSIKRRFVANLEHVLGEPHAALAAGLVVGEKSSLGKDLLNDFRIVGLIHIVVLSGFNITIVADALRRMLSFLPRVWGITVGGVGIGLFGILVGGGATVVRSCFMAGVALSADLIRRDYNVVRALMFAGLIMLIQNPMILLHDPSFQLSFLATLGLILLASPIEKKLGFIPEKFGMRGIVASTIATQIFVSPYILYMMGTISIIGMVVNILVLPLIPATMLFVFLTGAFGFFSGFLAHIVGWITHLLLSYELFMVEHFARIPFASATVPAFSFWWVVAFYVGFAGIFWWVRRRKSKVIGPLHLELVFRELKMISTGSPIPNHSDMLLVSRIPDIISQKIGLTNNSYAYISRMALKHIIERRGLIAESIVLKIPSAISNPSKVVDNSKKRKNSFLFLHPDDFVLCVVMEKTKTTWECQIVSAFPISPKTYEKMIGISGRAEFPPFELSP